MAEKRFVEKSKISPTYLKFYYFCKIEQRFNLLDNGLDNFRTKSINKIVYLCKMKMSYNMTQII